MSGYKRVSFYELCRLCASNIQKEKTHIFQEEGRKIQLQNKIEVCLALTVNENDFLPKVVCSKCLRSLETCFGFRQECVRSESMLSTYFKNFRYTDDFKKSGKVYIKDIKSTPLIQPTSESVSPVVTRSVQSTSQNLVNVNKSQQNADTVPFYTLQLPAIVSNPNIVSKPQKYVDPPKIPQNQLAYNLNLVNTTNNKLSTPKAEIFSNVVVNANGEVINISHMGDFETILNQGNALKVKNKTLKDINGVQESVVQIDLTGADNSNFDLKQEKLPHIKSTQSKYSYSMKIDDKNPNQSVIFPMSEYSQSFSNFNSNNVVYTQPNLSLVSTNSTNVITNAAPTLDNSALNVINQNLQEINQPAYTNVISSNVAPEPESCKTDLDQNNINNTSVNCTSSGAPKTHACEVCRRVFKRKEHLYQHVKHHIGLRPYTCEHCNKSFMRKEHLLRHSTLHSGQKNFTCNICDKSFSRNDNLLKHKKTHDKRTNYTCQVCQKQFVMKHYYNAHKCYMSTVWGFLKT
ncbi:zinc finger protein 717-like [Diorhabda sublineata]|uniref:zinc finger protein 717-like n=1 Tax=Diorhabda sublineata TaxID=1163346 RepID=UPI0024E17861|nr:zinc finger protein 717-like [Diorhabda sublineata]